MIIHPKRKVSRIFILMSDCSVHRNPLKHDAKSTISLEAVVKSFFHKFNRLRFRTSSPLRSPNMPLWRIFAHPDTFSPPQRAAFAKDITDYYVDKGLPAFYVNVFFIPLEAENFFIGGTPRTNFVRISIEHIARHYPDGDTRAGKEYREGRMELINQVPLFFCRH